MSINERECKRLAECIHRLTEAGQWQAVYDALPRYRLVFKAVHGVQPLHEAMQHGFEGWLQAQIAQEGQAA